MSMEGSKKKENFESSVDKGSSMPSPTTSTTPTNNNGGDNSPVPNLFSRLFQPSPKPASATTNVAPSCSNDESVENVPVKESPEAKPPSLQILPPDHHDASVELQEPQELDELEDNRSMVTMTTNATTTDIDMMRDLHDDLEDTADNLSQLQVEFETDLQALAVGLESAFEMPTEFDFGSVHTGMSRMTTDGREGDMLSVTSLNCMEELASIITSMDDDDNYDDDDDYFGIEEPEEENRDESLLRRKSSEKKQAQAMEAFMTTMEAKMRQAQQSQQSPPESPAAGLLQEDALKDSNHENDKESLQNFKQSTQQQQQAPPNQKQNDDDNGPLPQWLQQAWEKFHNLATLKQRMRHERIRRQQLKQQLLKQINEQQHIQLKKNQLQTIQEDDIGMDVSTGDAHSLDGSATTKSSSG